MHGDLSAFFQVVPAFLAGSRSAAQVEAQLGPCPSGTEALAFYRTLMERNAFKLLREIFPSVRAALVSEDPGRWRTVVQEFAAAHPCGHWNPNEFGAPFPEYLRQAAGRGEVPDLVAELADYHLVQYRVSVAPAATESDDGWDRTLFIRQYTHPVAAYAAAVERGPGPVALPSPQPTIVLVYRAKDRVHWLHPTPPQLAALARRRGLELPLPLAQLDPTAVEEADGQLVGYGVFSDRETPT